ncbi:GNAT family N-acetyltransferase [Streptomyces sp. NPDC060194]|uniref:GNAT family N-acetyltransferase n=1 Tax=Streptomyces sp. NPDC060194 TaxID=3347069 RepID=UPI003668091F
MQQSDEPAVRVTPMTIRHLPDVLDLGHRAFGTGVKPYTGWSLSAAAVHVEAPEPACFVALRGDELCGFVLGSMTFEQRADWGYLEWIAVGPAARGQGVAGRLVTACRERLEALGAAAVITDVEARNEASTALMHRHGFEVRATVNLLVHTTRPAGLAQPHPLSRSRRSAALG